MEVLEVGVDTYRFYVKLSVLNFGESLWERRQQRTGTGTPAGAAGKTEKGGGHPAFVRELGNSGLVLAVEEVP